MSDFIDLTGLDDWRLFRHGDIEKSRVYESGFHSLMKDDFDFVFPKA